MSIHTQTPTVKAQYDLSRDYLHIFINALALTLSQILKKKRIKSSCLMFLIKKTLSFWPQGLRAKVTKSTPKIFHLPASLQKTIIVLHFWQTWANLSKFDLKIWSCKSWVSKFLHYLPNNYIRSLTSQTKRQRHSDFLPDLRPPWSLWDFSLSFMRKVNKSVEANKTVNWPVISTSFFLNSVLIFKLSKYLLLSCIIVLK